MYVKGQEKNYQNKGALFIEYAMILAFVVVVGVVFLSSEGMSASIASIFGKAEDTLELAANNGKKYTSYSVQTNTGWSCNEIGGFSDSKTSDWAKKTNRTDELIPMGEPGTYQFTIDYDNMKDFLAQQGISVSTEDVKKYLDTTNIGYFCLKENGKLSENHFQRYTEDNGGTFTNTNTNIKDGSNNWSGNSGEIDLSRYISGKDKYYQIVTTENDGKTFLRYNICHNSEANAIKYQKYDEALINAGMTIKKVE